MRVLAIGLITFGTTVFVCHATKLIYLYVKN